MRNSPFMAVATENDFLKKWLWNDARRKIAAAQGWKCAYCPKTLVIGAISIDHKMPRSRGGTNNWENLCACCKECNHLKGSLTDTEFRALQRVAGDDHHWLRYLVKSAHYPMKAERFAQNMQIDARRRMRAQKCLNILRNLKIVIVYRHSHIEKVTTTGMGRFAARFAGATYLMGEKWPQAAE